MGIANRAADMDYKTEIVSRIDDYLHEFLTSTCAGRNWMVMIHIKQNDYMYV